MSENLLFEEIQAAPEKVLCLGMEFENEETRRAYFTELLRIKLLDPEFRRIEGFPIGADVDILALSDPPYYTACPNPWIAAFVAEWEVQKPPKPEGYSYHRQPFAADVSEGKNHPIYNAHSYHTKVPHQAIMRYILHYTLPGEVVSDSFCGTGMTGVAALLCGDRTEVTALGYKVLDDGIIMQEVSDDNGQAIWQPFSKLGVRRTVLSDISPVASLISHNYNTPVFLNAFEKEAKRILKEVEEECSWMFETKHHDGRNGKINFTVWSDVFVCPECTSEVIFWKAAVDTILGSVKDSFNCPECAGSLTKQTMDRAWVIKYDKLIAAPVRQSKQVPVLVNYTIDNKRFEKKPDVYDLDILEKIASKDIPHWVPAERMIEGQETRRNDSIGVTHVHQYYTDRNLWVMAAFRERIFGKPNSIVQLGMWFTSSHVWGTRLNRLLASNYFKKTGGVIGQTLQGTLYISSIAVETNLIERFALRVKSVPFTANGGSGIVETCSASESSLPSASVDYLFIDPPFGSNINYSELNSLWESWLGARTNIAKEAIENKSQGKSLDDYRRLMTAGFTEAFRVLKPGRWVTVEFSNTKAAVWNSIQTALMESGFVVANVSILEKSHKGYRAVTTPTAVKQDLVISAYKPNGGLEERFINEASSEEGVWDFARTHLKYLPITKRNGMLMQMIQERDPRIIFDQMVAYYLRKGFSVPMSSQEFQNGLSQRFSERDGMYFLPEQALEYDQKKLTSGELVQASLFVSDEATAIQWLRRYIQEKPHTTSEINPHFMPLFNGWSKTEQLLDLRELLQQNFLCYEGEGQVPDMIYAYLRTHHKELEGLGQDHPLVVSKANDHWYLPDPNKASDLEKLRERALLKEFDVYRNAKKRLKVFRLEAVRAGFKKAWQERDYYTIINVAELIPHNVLEEDPKLLMWYDQALTRKGGE